MWYLEEKEIAIQISSSPSPPRGTEKKILLDGSAGDGKVGIGIFSSAWRRPDCKGIRKDNWFSKYPDGATCGTCSARRIIRFIHNPAELGEFSGNLAVKMLMQLQISFAAAQWPRPSKRSISAQTPCIKLRTIRAGDGPKIPFQWVPAHSKVEGNEKGNTLA